MPAIVVSPVVVPTVAVIPSETALQHIESILGLLGKVLEALLPIAAVVTAPFVKDTKSQAIEATELPIVEGVAGTIAEL
jgi:hypothetical protein